jgi:FSR family fosmidomycin resistance protein-like MFS transporter
VALAVELADELVDGAKGAALPLIRHDLGLSYGQIGLLASVPLLVGGALELPLGLFAGAGRRRRRVVLGGGIVFILSLLAVAGARSFIVLLVAFTVFYPASGAFVSLTQAELMEAWPDRQAQIMARWDLAGSAGAVAGPLLLTAVLAAGGDWRVAYLMLAALALAAWLGTCGFEPHPVRVAGTAEPAADRDPEPGVAWMTRAREVLAALRDWSAVRWALLTVVADLLVDVLTGFLALYLVDVAHLRPAVAALAIAIRLGAGLAGDAALVLVLDRVADVTVLRVSAVAVAALPGFPARTGTSGQGDHPGRAERGHGAVVPAAAGQAVRQPARAQSCRGHAEQRGRAGGRARTAGGGAERRGVRVVLGAGGPGGRPGRGAGRVGQGGVGQGRTGP